MWQRLIGWTLATVLLVIIVALAGGYLFLQSERFQQFAIRRISETAERSIGGKTEIRAFDFSLSTLTAHLYDVVIHGRELPGQPPLLRIEKLTVGFKIESMFRRKVSLADLLIAHAVMHVEVDRNGESNIPQPPSTGSSGKTSVFDLAVRHVQLKNGEVDYKDQKIPMDADLYNLGTEIHFDSLATRYTGTISYDNGHVRYAQYAPLAHSMHVNFSATRTQLSLEPATFTVGSSKATVRINLSNYDNPSFAGDYTIQIHTQDFASMAPSIQPVGDVLLAGSLRCQNVGNESLLHALFTDGGISSDFVSAAASTGRIEARRLKGTYQLQNGSLRVTGINMDTLGGIVQANLDMQHLDATPTTQIHTSFRRISLQAAQRSLHRPELRHVALLGILDGSGHASWTGSIDNIRAAYDLNLRATALNGKDSDAGSANALPVDGVIHATYDGRYNAIGLRASTLHVSSTTVTAQGEISNHSNLQVRVSVGDLQQLVALAAALKPNAPAPPALSGSAMLNATIRGSVKRPDIIGELTAENLIVQGSEWRSAQATLEATPAALVISNGILLSAHRGRASFSCAVSLQDWSYMPENAIKAYLSLQKMPLADLERLANAQYPVNGDLSATISFNGSQLNPEGSGTLRVSNGQAYGEPVQNIAAKFDTDHGAITSSVDVAIPAGSANADLTFAPKTKAYTVNFHAASIALEKLNAIRAKNLLLSGNLTASVSGTGTLDNPQLRADVQVPRLSIRGKSISGLKAQLALADRKANFTLNSEVVEASVKAHGQLNLTGDYYTEASVDTTKVPLDVLLAPCLPSLPQGFQGQTEFHATLKGPLKDRSQLEAHLTIPTFNATYQSLQIGAPRPIRADFTHSVITLQPAEIQGTGTSLRLQGSIPVAGNSAPTLIAQGSLDVSVLKIILPDVQSSGVISLDIHASGNAQRPNVNGQVRLQNVAVIQPGTPLGVEKLNGTLDIDNERVHLSNLAGQVGGGTLSASGSITFHPSLEFNLALMGQSVRVRYPDGIRTLIDANLAFTGTRDSSTLNGRVLVDSLSFTPEFDLATFGDQFSSNVATPVQPGFADTVNLGIAVQSKENLSANSSQVSLEGNVNLHVGGTAAYPVITGRTDLTAGELFYRNARYRLERGIITFDDPNQTRPVLNVAIASTIAQYNLTLNLRGPVDKLTTSYVSDPPLATADIINLLASGKTTQESAASQSTDSMIASQAASRFSGSVEKLAGLSSLQIDPLIGGNSQNPSARIAVQQRVSKNFLFTFSTDVTQPGSEVVQGDYQVSRRWSVSVARQQAGGVSAEGRFHKKF